MRIIIEGADGAGKSTLAEKLKEYYGDVDIVHMRGKDPMTFRYLYETLDKTKVIWDRQFISERIYSTFYNLPYRLRAAEEKVLVQKCKDENIPIIILSPDQHKVLGDEDEDIKSNHDDLVKMYMMSATKHKLKVYGHNDFDTIISDIENRNWYLT